MPSSPTSIPVAQPRLTAPRLQVLKALEAVIDPDFAMNIVDCGFVKDLTVDSSAGSVAFRLELTTPACPIKDEFERQATAVVEALPWVSNVRPLLPKPCFTRLPPTHTHRLRIRGYPTPLCDNHYHRYPRSTQEAALCDACMHVSATRTSRRLQAADRLGP